MNRLAPSKGEQSPKMFHLQSLNNVEKKEFVNSFDFIVTDIDDIFCEDSKRRAIAGEIINGMRKMKKFFYFVVSDSYVTEDDVIKSFEEIGVGFVTDRHILTPAKLMYRYLKGFKKDRPVFSLCNSIMNDYLTEHDIKVKKNPPREDVTLCHLNNKLMAKKDYGAVLLDVNFNIDFNALAVAHQYLKNNPQTDLICASSEIHTRISSEFETAGTVGFITLLLEGLKKDPVILCRPSEYVGTEILKYFSIDDPWRVLYIGNSLVKDMQFAKQAGFRSLFLKNQNVKTEDTKALPSRCKPDFIAEEFTDLLKFVRNELEYFL